MEPWATHAAAIRAPERRQRKDAIAALNERLKEPIESKCGKEAFEVLRTSLIACLSDEAEACREAGAAAVSALVAAAPPSDYVLTYVVDALRRRLVDDREPSEEVRLALLRLACVTVECHSEGDHLVPFQDKLVDVALAGLTDDYGEACKQGCQLVELLAAALPRDFHMRAETVVAKACPLFSHRHYKLRAAAVQCVGIATLKGNEACLEMALKEITKPLIDDTASVRLAAVRQVGTWALLAPDRYSYFHRIIPCILTGLCDEADEVSSEAKNIWDKVGLQYEAENEDDLKPQADFLDEIPSHYPQVPRPNLGCRTLVSKNVGKIAPAIKAELDGWQAELRFRSAQILRCLILHAELKNTQYASNILDSLIRGAKDDETRVVEETRLASEYFGHFVGPNIWWDYLMADIDSRPGLVVLANLIKGSDAERLKGKYFRRILKELSCNRMLTIQDPVYKMNVLHVCESLMNVCTVHCQPVSQDMFNILFTIYAMPVTEEVEHRALCLLGKLRETIQLGENIDDLYATHIRSLLANITSDADFWTSKTPEKCILKAILLHTGIAVGLYLHLIAPLLVEVLSSSIAVSSDIKLEIFTSICSMLLQRDERLRLAEPRKVNAFMNVMIQNVIVPNLRWQAGLTAEAMRTIAVCCLCAILQDNETVTENDGDIDFKKCVKPIDLFPDEVSLQQHVNDLLPSLLALVTDNSKKTRHYALRTICCLVKVAKRKNCFDAKHLHKSYSDILTRLDDPIDKVRLAAVETLCTLFMARPESYDPVMFSSHVDALYSAMLSHLDDPDTIFQDHVLDALKKICSVHPKLLKGKVEASMKLFRNQKALEHLDKHLESLSI